MDLLKIALYTLFIYLMIALEILTEKMFHSETTYAAPMMSDSSKNPSPGSNPDEGASNSHNNISYGSNQVGAQPDLHQVYVLNATVTGAAVGAMTPYVYNPHPHPIQALAGSAIGAITSYQMAPVPSKEDAEEYKKYE